MKKPKKKYPERSGKNYYLNRRNEEMRREFLALSLSEKQSKIDDYFDTRLRLGVMKKEDAEAGRKKAYEENGIPYLDL